MQQAFETFWVTARQFRDGPLRLLKAKRIMLSHFFTLCPEMMARDTYKQGVFRKIILFHTGFRFST